MYRLRAHPKSPSKYKAFRLIRSITPFILLSNPIGSCNAAALCESLVLNESRIYFNITDYNCIIFPIRDS